MPAGTVTIVSFPQGLGEKGAERIQASEVLLSGSQDRALTPAALLLSVISPWPHPAWAGWCLDLCPVPLGRAWL